MRNCVVFALRPNGVLRAGARGGANVKSLRPWAARSTDYGADIRMYACVVGDPPPKPISANADLVGEMERSRVIRHQLVNDILFFLKTVEARSQQSQLVVQGDDRAQFCKESTRYSASAKLKHRLLTRLGYRVLHVPFYEWSKVKPKELATAYLQRLISRQNFEQCGDLSEWLDLDDQSDWTRRRLDDQEHIGRMVGTIEEPRKAEELESDAVGPKT